MQNTRILSSVFKALFFGMLAKISILFAFAEVENIDNQKLRLLLSQGVPVIDIREEFEWKETGVLPKSHLLTFFDSDGRYDVKSWLNNLDKIINRADPLILICRSGRRSLLVATYLSDIEKFKKVYNVESGIKAWKSDDFKTTDFE